jgi:hypothetical protein
MEASLAAHHSDKIVGKSGEGGSGVVHRLCEFWGGLRCEGTTCRGISTTVKKAKVARGVERCRARQLLLQK